MSKANEKIQRTHQNLQKRSRFSTLMKKLMTMTEYNFFFAALILFLLINLIGRLENIPQIILNVNEITKSFSLFVILLTRALFALNTNKITFKTKTKETSMRQILCFFFSVYEN